MTVCAHCDADLGASDRTVQVCGFCFGLTRADRNNGAAVAAEGSGSIRELVPEGSVMAEVLTSVPVAIQRLPVLPEIPRRVVASAHDPLTSMHDLAQLITEDAGLAMRILRRANSAAASPVNTITGVTQACTQLGLKAIIQLAQAEMCEHLYRQSPTPIRELTQRLWRHNVITAYMADALARAAEVSDSESAFLAGLVHDVGKLVLLDAVFNVHRGRIGRLGEDTGLLASVLAQYGPWVGAYVVQQWELPEPFVLATFLCAEPESASVDLARDLARVVHLASGQAAAHGFDLFEAPAEVSTESNLALSGDRIAAITAEIAARADDLIDVAPVS